MLFRSVLTKKGERKTISDVYYVPDMKCNLLSIGQLIQKGYNVFFEDNVCTIMDKPPRNKCITQVKMKRNIMFPLKMRADLKKGVAMVEVTQGTFQREAKDENWLWHLRFVHLNFRGLNLLHRKGTVKGLSLIEKPNNLCEGFILGKQHRERFPTRKSIREKSTL